MTGEAYSTYVADGLIRRDDLAGLNLSRVPAVFIECANMRNATDAAKVTSAAWRQKAAAGIVAGHHGLPAPLRLPLGETLPASQP